jgi:hypothetical protein
MIAQIEHEKKLKKYTTRAIEDAGLKIDVDPKLRNDDYIAIKVDDYYNGLKLGGETPKSVDFIVSVDCECNSYVLYVLELKNTKRVSFQTKEIHEKFETAFEDFMKVRFCHIFQNDSYKYKDVKLYIVSTAYIEAARFGDYANFKMRMTQMNQRDTANRDRQMSDRLYRFRGQIYRIQRECPPNPLIQRIL